MKSHRTRVLAVSAAVAIFGAAAVAAIFSVGAGTAEPSKATLELGSDIYVEHCAACHGTGLEGQPDWKQRLPSGRMPAPPHDVSGHTWHHADEVLFRITKEGAAAVVGGGYESDMPGFGDVLSDEEIRAVLAYIKSTWPERERAYQAEMTRYEQEAD